MTRRATISDVAAAANVSRAAVSKVLQGAYGVSDDMRQRVNTAIEQLNYRPLVSARGLRGATFTFGITIPDFRNHFFSEVIRGAVEFLADTPYQLLTSPVDQGHREGYRAIEALYDRQVDGILTISPLVETAWLEDMALRVPVVELGRHDIAKNYDVVRGDDAAGTRAVMEHLFSLGHTRIAHVAQVDAEASGADVTPPAIRRRVYEELMDDLPSRLPDVVARRSRRAEEIELRAQVPCARPVVTIDQALPGQGGEQAVSRGPGHRDVASHVGGGHAVGLMRGHASQQVTDPRHDLGPLSTLRHASTLASTHRTPCEQMFARRAV